MSKETSGQEGLMNGICQLSLWIPIPDCWISSNMARDTFEKWKGEDEWPIWSIAMSYASESKWYLINAYAGRKLIRWAIVLMLARVMAFVYPFNGDALSSILYGLIVLIIFLIPTIETISYSRTL
jgi:hypothetical protein